MIYIFIQITILLYYFVLFIYYYIKLKTLYVYTHTRNTPSEHFFVFVYRAYFGQAMIKQVCGEFCIMYYVVESFNSILCYVY